LREVIGIIEFLGHVVFPTFETPSLYNQAADLLFIQQSTLHISSLRNRTHTQESKYVPVKRIELAPAVYAEKQRTYYALRQEEEICAGEFDVAYYVLVEQRH